MTDTLILSRREVLKAGSLVVAFTLTGSAGTVMAQPQKAAVPAAPSKPLMLTEVDSFLTIDTDGAVTVYSGKVDLGTGVKTALTQIVADELDVPMSSVRIVQGDTLTTPDQGPTFGSVSIQIGGMQIRNAAALARAALLEAAVKRLNAKPEELSIENGVITSPTGQVAFGQLIGGKTFNLKVDHTKPPPWKDAKAYKRVGTSVARLDIPDKVTGRFTYIHDVRVPGMLHGRVVRPPAIGAELETVDEASIKAIPGVVKVVREGNFLGVVAQSEWSAIRAARDLKATWSEWKGLPEQSKLYDYVRATKVAKDEVTGNIGNTAEAMAKEGVKKLAATYDFAIHTHGSIGPSCAIAEFEDGKLTSWSASQMTHSLRKQLAKMLALPVDNVRCIYVEGSGCYGRNGHEDAAADAAILAKAVGKPVRVQWSRADEHGWDPKGPPTLIDVRAALDGANVVAWESEFFIPQQTPNM
ncbi:molybdopterin cofactor-binding domain-containing protein, partial [Bradyrhizobium sp.]|uniref:molybdopterin cofactor-binding domain-containing protein n=1 Tax=Bradyrhizobium sp. TaxID=376 RepID=UPI003C4A9B70